MRQRLGPPEQKVEPSEVALDFVLEGDLGARKETDSYSRLPAAAALWAALGLG